MKTMSRKRRKLIGFGLGVIPVFLVVFLPVWFLIINVDDEKAETVELAECKSDGLGSDVHALL